MTADGIGAEDLRGAMGTGAPLLEVRRLSAHAATAARPLLHEVSLSVPARGVTAVVGPSGSGKTTLGLAALGAARPGVRLEGRALLEGEDLLAADEARRRALRSGTTGHLAQHPETVLDPVRRVGSGLRAVAALRHRGRAARAAAVREALETAGLPRPELRRRFPHQLSGGEQQRAALASVLVTGPRLLVLDEPTSGLDSPAAVALARRLRALADAGTGLLLLSHDLALVRELADRVAVLEGGRVVEEGPARQVLAAGEGPAHPLTRGLLTAERRAGAAAYGQGSAGGSGAEAEHSGEGVAATGVAVRGRDGGHLLRGPVTLSFPPGSTTALTGPSGSGKTTFGRVLAGLTAATTGEVTYGGARLPSRIQRRTAAQRRAVQYVHQSSSESFEARAPLLGQLAAAGRLLRGMTPEVAEEEALRAARLLGLEDAQLARTPGRLSGGQLQRCALVRAVLARPALLVCDEVTSALDVVSRERLLAALPVLLEPARTALLFISHDLDAAYAAAERAVVFEAGRCVRQGTAADVLRRAPEPQAALVRPEMDPAREGG